MAAIFVFGFDVGEPAQIRRIRSLRAAGHGVRSATFRRSGAAPDLDWPNLDLGPTAHGRPLRRVLAVAAGAARMALHRRALVTAEVIVARNLDMLAIAWAARATAGSRAPLVYECLDIHDLLTRRGPAGAAARWIERRLLARTRLVLVSSPAFAREHFGRVQGHGGPIALLENKLWFDGAPLPRPRRPRHRDGPLTLGWVGSLRCAPSLALLLAAAEAMGDGLRLRLFGEVHRHALPGFDALIAGRPNVSHHGPYRYPDGLAHAYAGCDLVWAQDLWQRGGNSDWLLPNRIYEAGWFGCPSVAVAGTETGRRVAADGLGLVVPDADPASLVALLRGLDPAALRACSAALLARSERDFRLTTAEIDAALAPVLPPAAPPRRSARPRSAGGTDG